MKSKKTKKGVRILFAVSEVAPFLTTGGLGQVVGALPMALKSINNKHELCVVAPLYAQVRERYISDLELIGETTTALSWRNQYCGIYRAVRDGVTFYFVDNLQYFDRESAYGYDDDGERFAFFSKAVFSVIEYTGFIPDIIHAHDWQTALVPVYLKTRFHDQHSGVRTVFTIHNMEYQGRFPREILQDVFELEEAERGIVEYDGCINLMKGAIVCADSLTTVSPSYAKEITSEPSGHGLGAIISENAYKLRGIINGIDTRLYDPAADATLERNYSADTPEDKSANKLKLQELFNLPRAPRKLLICVITRLVSHKGIDLITYIMDALLKHDVQFLLLGTGDHAYELFFTEKALQYPGKVGVNIAYNPELAGKIYAGADVMLMPSQSEPCGLAQMIACRYGTIPVVRKTGGLGDTIRDCRSGSGNGFVFEEYKAGALLDTLLQALEMYAYREEDWKNLMREAMNTDFSWDFSAAAYEGIYEGLCQK